MEQRPNPDPREIGGAVVHLHLLGTPHWAGGPALSRKDAALVALLALDGPQAREVLAGRLWPEVDDTKAAGSLRQRISRLRRDTGHRLVNTGAALSLAEGVSVDVHTIASMDDAQLCDAGELLAGFAYADNEFLDGWLRAEREHWRHQRAEALAGRAAALEHQGRLAEALRLNQRILELTPLHEHGLRRQMRLHYLRGDRIAAIQAFEHFEALLREQTGGRPGDETLELLRTIEHAEKVAPAHRAVLPASLLRPPRLVGRAHEWQAMASAWEAGRAFLLTGDAGMGKSRLLADFVHDMPGIVTDRGRPGDAQTPYAVLARLLRGACEGHARQLDGPARRELARLLPELGPAPDVPGQQASLWRAVEKLLEHALAAGLAGLVVDDLHYADLATVEALRWLAASPALQRLRLGLAARPADAAPIGDALRAWLDDSHRPQRIVLPALTRADVAELIESLGLPQLAAPGLADQLVQHAGGHPLFTLETLKAYVAGGAGDHALPQPATVQTLLDQRLRALPAEAYALLRVAAVCGNELTVERAAHLLERRPVDLADAWSALEAADILRGTRFAHDLVQDSALRLLPEPIRGALHAAVAELLAGQAGVAPGRVAEHWEAAERWDEAAACWQAAGVAAGQAGRLVEQQSLLERTAACARRAGNVAREFDALHGRLEGMLIRLGPAAVLDEIAPLRRLAHNEAQRLKLALIEAEALVDLQRGGEALGVSERALRWADAHPSLLADAMAMHGMALAQTGRSADAIALLRDGSATAERLGTPAQTVRVLNALLYALYEAGEVAQAVAVGRDIVRRAEALGDYATAIATEGNVVSLLLVQGDPEAAYEPARRVRRHYVEMGSTAGSTLLGMNLAAVGNAAAYLGRFDEALEALAEANRLLAPPASAAVHHKARVALASVWLTLGQPGAARDALGDISQDTRPWMAVQSELCLARAAALDGHPPDEHYRRMGAAMADTEGVPLVQLAWIEWSRRGDAAEVVERLRAVRTEYERVGLSGTARTLLLREIDRLHEIGTPEAAAQAAERAAALLHEVAKGLQASTYLPEAWLILARAFEQGGRRALARECRGRGIAWIREQALANVPAPFRDTFLACNPVNRVLLG